MSGITDIPLGAGQIWTPSGVVHTGERAVAQAIKEYDETLVLGQRQDSGEWVVFIEHGPNDGEPFPVLGLGFRLPGVDEVKKKLYHHDIRRHGAELVYHITKRREEAEKEAERQRSEQTEHVAERMEYTMRKLGNETPLSSRIFVPKEVGDGRKRHSDSGS